MQYIFTCFSKLCCVCLSVPSLELHPGELNYSLALQCHAGQTTVLQALTLDHIRSNDYLTTKILSIMSTNCCSPTSK